MIDVTTTHFFECKEYEPSSSGGVAYYLLQAIPKGDGEQEVIRLKPSDIASYAKFRTALLNRRIFYLSSKAEHKQNLMRLFDAPPHAA